MDESGMGPYQDKNIGREVWGTKSPKKQKALLRLGQQQVQRSMPKKYIQKKPLRKKRRDKCYLITTNFC